MSSVTINGKTYQASGSISIINGKVYANGKLITEEDAKEPVKVIVEGELIALKTGGEVEVHGNVNGKIDAGGSVHIHGNVRGNVDAGNSIHCGDVTGSVDAGNSVDCGNIGGDVDAGGRVHYRK